MKHPVTILVTGGTGFLGQHVVPLLKTKYRVLCLSRSDKADIQGDLTKWDAGLDLNSLKKENISVFLHMAGLYDLKASSEDVFSQNVLATNMALRVSSQLEIPFFMNTSSVAAAVNSGVRLVRPLDLNFQRPFHESYGESKALTERQIQNWNLPHQLRVNLRLGILVGDSKSGKIDRIDGPYHAAEAIEKARSVLEMIPGKIPLPGNPRVRLPLVPVDKTAEAILKFVDWTLTTEERGYKSFHLTPKEGVSIIEFYRSMLKHRYVKHRGVQLVSKLPQGIVTKVSEWVAHFPEEQVRYVFQMPKYDSLETRHILGDNWCPEFYQYEKSFWSGYEKYISNR